MHHISEITSLLSWPILIFASYVIIYKAIKIYEKKFSESNEDKMIFFVKKKFN